MARLQGIPGSEWPPEMFDALAALTPPTGAPAPRGPLARQEPSRPRGLRDPPGPGQGLLHVQPPRPVGTTLAPVAPHHHPAGGRPSAGGVRLGRARVAGPRRRAHRRRDHRHRVTGRRTVRFRRRGRPAAGGRRPHRRRCRLFFRVAGAGRRSHPTQLVDVVFTAGCYNTVASFTRSIEPRWIPTTPTSSRRGMADQAGAVRLPRPTSVDEAVGMLASLGDTAKVLAGGQASFPCWRCGPPSERLVDLRRVEELKTIGRRNGTLWLSTARRRPPSSGPRRWGRPYRSWRGRRRSSGTSRSATAARSVARSPMPTRPPSTPRWPWPSTPSWRCSLPPVGAPSLHRGSSPAPGPPPWATTRCWSPWGSPFGRATSAAPSKSSPAGTHFALAGTAVAVELDDAGIITAADRTPRPRLHP